MMHRLEKRLPPATAFAVLLAVVAAPASSQTLEELNASAQRAGDAEDLAPDEVETDEGETDAVEPTGPSELDALSKRADDPFPEVGRAASDRTPVAVTVRALNKVTAKYVDLTIDMDDSERFGTLEIVARHCDKRPPEEFPETTAFLQIFDRGYDAQVLSTAKRPDFGGSETVSPDLMSKIDNPDAPPGAEPLDVAGVGHDEGIALASAFGDGEVAEGDSVFSGWMFASSPALNPLEHPVYDVWVIDCQTEIADAD